jgi:hypothetical protein
MANQYRAGLGCLHMATQGLPLAKANNKAIRASKIVSPKNCTDSWNRCAPIDLRIPTSLARSAERAVLKGS